MMEIALALSLQQEQGISGDQNSGENGQVRAPQHVLLPDDNDDDEDEDYDDFEEDEEEDIDTAEEGTMDDVVTFNGIYFFVKIR